MGNTLTSLNEFLKLYPELGTFDFEMTQEQETRAAKLHKESIVIDIVNQHPAGRSHPDEFQPYPRPESP